VSRHNIFRDASGSKVRQGKERTKTYLQEQNFLIDGLRKPILFHTITRLATCVGARGGGCAENYSYTVNLSQQPRFL
jgi:hypothetical protein